MYRVHRQLLEHCYTVCLNGDIIAVLDVEHNYSGV